MRSLLQRRLLVVLLASGFALFASCSKRTSKNFTTHAGTKIFWERYSRGIGHATSTYGEVWTETGSKVIDHLTGCPPYVIPVINSNYVIASDDKSGKHPTVYFIDVVTGKSFSAECPDRTGLSINCDGICSAEQASPNQITIFLYGTKKYVLDIAAKEFVPNK